MRVRHRYETSGFVSRARLRRILLHVPAPAAEGWLSFRVFSIQDTPEGKVKLWKDLCDAVQKKFGGHPVASITYCCAADYKTGVIDSADALFEFLRVYAAYTHRHAHADITFCHDALWLMLPRRVWRVVKLNCENRDPCHATFYFAHTLFAASGCHQDSIFGGVDSIHQLGWKTTTGSCTPGLERVSQLPRAQRCCLFRRTRKTTAPSWQQR